MTPLLLALCQITALNGAYTFTADRTRPGRLTIAASSVGDASRHPRAIGRL